MKENGKKIFIGEWKSIPRRNFLNNLKPGRYFLQSSREMSRKVREKLKSLNGNGGQDQISKKDDIGKDLVETLEALSEQINKRIDMLDGVPGGGNDKMLDDMFYGMNSLLKDAYDSYVQVQPDYYRVNNRQHLMIDIQEAPGLRYYERNGHESDKKEGTPRSGSHSSTKK